MTKVGLPTNRHRYRPSWPSVRKSTGRFWAYEDNTLLWRKQRFVYPNLMYVPNGSCVQHVVRGFYRSRRRRAGRSSREWHGFLVAVHESRVVSVIGRTTTRVVRRLGQGRTFLNKTESDLKEKYNTRSITDERLSAGGSFAFLVRIRHEIFNAAIFNCWVVAHTTVVTR